MSPSDEERSEPTEGDKLEEVDLGLGTKEARKQPYVLQEDAARDECEGINYCFCSFTWHSC